MKNFILMCVICFLGLLPAIAQSYNNTVHFFLTVVVVRHIEPAVTEDEKRLISLCVQLPDETEEYDAMKGYWKFFRSSFGDYMSWATNGNDNENMQSILAESVATRELVTVQQLLHGLTGGTASEMLTTAGNIIESLMAGYDEAQTNVDKVNRLCAIGFAVHLLGDTLAHRRLDSGGLDAPGKMYPTGKGHAFDGTKPDNLLKSVTGLDGLKLYNSKIPSSFPDNRILGTEQLQSLYTHLETASKKWFRADAAARQAIIEEVGPWATEEHLRPDKHENESCQAYLNTVIPALTDGQCVPDCNSVFSIFADTAKLEFEDSHESRLPKLSLDDYVYPTVDGDPLTCPDFGNPAPGS